VIFEIVSWDSSVPSVRRQVVGDVAHGHPARVQRDDHVVEAAGPADPFRDQPWLERPGPVPRHRQRDVADLGGHRLGRRAVARVGRTPPGRIALLIAQVLGELGLQPALEHRLDHLGEEATLPGQRQTTGVDALHQLVEQAGVEHVVNHIARRTRPRAVLRDAQRMPRRAIFGHGHLCTPQLKRILLHRPSDTLSCSSMDTRT